MNYTLKPNKKLTVKKTLPRFGGQGVKQVQAGVTADFCELNRTVATSRDTNGAGGFTLDVIKPFLSCLIYGDTFSGDPVHSVWAYNQENQWAVLITVYRPDPRRWIDWRTRRPKDAPIQ